MYRSASHFKLSSRCLPPLGIVPRRGLAALITLVAVSVITVGSVAYLAARAAAPAASQQVADAAAARANADTGIELATAIMKLPSVDWRTKHTAGVLVQDYNYGGGTLTIKVAGPDGAPPTSTTENVTITATGTTNGVDQVAEAQVYAPVVDTRVDVDLSEFAIFGAAGITIADSTIQPWLAAPTSEMNLPIYLGTNSTSAAAVRLNAGARVCDAKFVSRGDASAALISDASGTSLRLTTYVATNNQSLPIPNSPTPSSTGYTATVPLAPSLTGGGTTTRMGTFRSSSVTMSNRSVLVIGGTPGGYAVTGNVSLDTASRIEVTGTADIIILGNLSISNGAGIYLTPGASARVYVRGSITVDGGRLGIGKDYAALTDSELAQGGVYADPSKFMLYSDPAGAATTWTFRNNSVVQACVYAPQNAVGFDTNARLFGNLVCNQAQFQGRSALLYDPALNVNRGYTNPQTVLYSALRVLNSTVTSLVTALDSTTVTLVKSTANLTPINTSTREVRVRSIKRLGMKLALDSDDASTHYLGN